MTNKSDFCQLQLTCANQAEADKIQNTLLARHLAACVRQLPVSSKFSWQGRIESAEEVLLVAESRLDKFDAVEAEIAKLHSYDTFVLVALPLANLSKGAQSWLSGGLNV